MDLVEKKDDKKFYEEWISCKIKDLYKYHDYQGEKMGIQSTRHISRDDAINRIKKVIDLIEQKNYRKLESLSSENDQEYDIQSFIDNWEPIDISKIEYWTDKMLEKQMDVPFFRISMFDNYLIKSPDDSDELD